MSMPSQNPAPSSHVPWGVALAAGTLLLIGGGALVWSSHGPRPQDASAPEFVATPVSDELMVMTRTLPVPPPTVALHPVAYTVENGTRVVKIKVIDSGDELVVDAATGRLLEARPSRPTAPPPAGRFAAPFLPLT